MQITVTNLVLSGSDRPRLNNVSLKIRDQSTAIVGYSGAGKTSLLNVLAGFEVPDSGTVDLKRDRTDSSLPLFWVPQNGGLWAHMTVRQHLTTLENALESQKLAISTDELLFRMDLQQRQTARPGQLSEGERSRLAIARALASGAEMLLLDEPLSHVDPARREKYWKVITEITETHGISLVFSSHELEAVIRESEQVICINEGQIIYHGPTRSLYDNPPNRIPGEFLGRLNWFTAGEAWKWLQQEISEDSVGIRPERVILRPDPSSLLEISETRYSGHRSETSIVNTQTGEGRSLLHRVEVSNLGPGDRVKIEWLAVDQD
ncbi:MAG: ATP-binding cassette domain-containing protein [Planctomycetaceae bacterium]|nr:ATP-binding cassette domain-containing protein [Planctomycetaceae bacterium]